MKGAGGELETLGGSVALKASVRLTINIRPVGASSRDDTLHEGETLGLASRCDTMVRGYAISSEVVSVAGQGDIR